MTPQQWQTIRALAEWIDASNRRTAHEITLRTTSKLSEELGEFAEAVEAGLRQEALAELVDVRLTAAVALCSITEDAEHLYGEHVASREAMAVPPWSPLLAVVALTAAVGAVAKARIGAVGQNPRKGRTHTADDVARELCKAIRIAEMSMQWFTDDPAGAFDAKLRKVTARVLTGEVAA